MKWQRKATRNTAYDGVYDYVCGEYSIRKTQSKNGWTGKVMSDQVWIVYKNGERVDMGVTLKDAKMWAERLMGKDN